MSVLSTCLRCVSVLSETPTIQDFHTFLDNVNLTEKDYDKKLLAYL